jgi:hypothetical protein
MGKSAFSLLLSSAVGIGCSQVKSAAPPPSALDRAHATLSAKLGGSDVSELDGGVSLSGFNFYREVDLGNGFRVLLISSNESGVLVFKPDGSLLGVKHVDPAVSLQIVDLDEDGTAELITEEITGSGTGVLMKAYRIYAVRGSGIERLWEGESYFHGKEPRKGRFVEQQRLAMLRVDFPAHVLLRYISLSPGGTVIRSTCLRLRDGALAEAPCSEDRQAGAQ